jgi:hypothetical protein
MSIKMKDTYAKIWEVEVLEKVIKVRLSTSDKDPKNEGKYINSNWFGAFVGSGKAKAEGISKGDRIKITSGNVSNITKGEGESKKTYTNVTIFDFEFVQNNNQTSNVSSDIELPF